MFAKLIVAALVATSAAFAPSRGVARSNSLKMGFERYVEDLIIGSRASGADTRWSWTLHCCAPDVSLLMSTLYAWCCPLTIEILCNEKALTALPFL